MKSILLVDDDQICNFLCTKALERAGNVSDINTALNGEQAISLFKNYYMRFSHLPDIILLDLNMPVMNGFEFLEAFSSLNFKGKEKVKIVVISSSANPADMKRAKALGAADYIPKPITSDRLKGVLN